MIYISDSAFDASSSLNDYPENSIERQILDIMSESGEKYNYTNLSQLKFEINLRREIVKSAESLNKSGLFFSVFKDSKANPRFWKRTDEGGFLLNENVKPSEAVNDIFLNGREYATECATAMMIVYYKALLNVFGGELFNKVFPKIYLMDWDVTDPILKDVTSPKLNADVLPGDRGYFSNPDFNPAASEWKGENVIVLPDSMYYGHGVGIRTAGAIIEILNSKRKENPTRSAYLQNTVWRPDFNKLYDAYNKASSQTAPLVWKPFPVPISFT